MGLFPGDYSRGGVQRGLVEGFLHGVVPRGLFRAISSR